MAKFWQRYLAWFSALQSRERLIVSAALLGGVLFIGFAYVIQPALLRAESAKRSTQNMGVQLDVLRQQLNRSQKEAADPDAALRGNLAAINASLAEQAQRFRVVERSVIAPQEMISLLESLLQRSRGLELVSMRSLPPVSLLQDAQKGDDKAPGAIIEKAVTRPVAKSGEFFRHGLELKLAGGYLDLLAYLEAIENEAPGVSWGRLDLKVETYPRSLMTVTLYTLSMDTSWLSL